MNYSGGELTTGVILGVCIVPVSFSAIVATEVPSGTVCVCNLSATSGGVDISVDCSGAEAVEVPSRAGAA